MYFRISIVVSIFWVLLISLQLDYIPFVEWITFQYHLDESQQKVLINSLLPLTRFYFFKAVVIASLPLVLLLFRIFKKQIKGTIDVNLIAIKKLWENLTSTWKNITTLQKVIAFISFVGIFSLRLALVSKLPMHIDEISTFLFFTDKGWAVSLAYYPSPNNHVFYTLLTTALYSVLKDPFWVIKLPSLLISSLTFPLFLMIVQTRTRNFWLSLTMTILFVSLPSVFYYGMMGRGYTLTLFCMMISFYSFQKLITDPKASLFLLLFVVSNIFATFTLPSYLYVLGGFVCWGLWKGVSWLSLLRWYVAMGLGIVILYIPILAFNDLFTISSSAWSIPLRWVDFPSALIQKLYHLGEFLMGWDVFGGIMLLVFLFGIFSKYPIAKDFKQVTFCFLLGILPILLIQKALPPTRVLIYMIIPLLFELVALAKRYRWTLVFVCMLIGVNIYHDVHIPDQWGFYQKIQKDIDHVVLSDHSKVYTDDDTYAIHLQYRMFLVDKEGSVEVIWKEGNHYDWVLVSQSGAKNLDLSDYQLVHNGEGILIYKHQ